MKNLKSNLMYALNIIIGVLTYVFLSQSYITLNASLGNFGGNTSIANGYEIISNYFEGDGTEVMMALSNLIVAILACILILSSIYCMLVNFGVLKKSKAIKISNFINIIVSLALVVFGAISLFCTLGHLDGLSSDGNGFIVGWAVIVNFVISTVALLTSFLGLRFSKKK